MRIISTSRIIEFYTKHANSKTGLQLFISRIKALKITNLNELRNVANSVDVIGNNRVIFNIQGNNYRLIAVVLVANQTVYIRWIGTHAEYDKINANTI
ncbi:type II toxin-antitoxin system HigB family toxin [Adhaeribacter pallidiroseus]|nr:type II toxin-antitoxin system HigB family toxin [Adhaeribacter pallidiroseus]